MKANKILALLLAAALLMTAAACTAEMPAEPEEPPSASAETIKAETPETPDAPEPEPEPEPDPEFGPVGDPVGAGSAGTVSWTLYRNGTLVISGTGPMESLWDAEPPENVDAPSSFDQLMENEEFAELWNSLMEDEDMDAAMFAELMGDDWQETLLQEYEENEENVDLENSLWLKMAPWEYVYETPVHAVFVEEGVTTVPEYAFDDSPDLVLAELAASVKMIGECAFWDCGSLASIKMPGVTSIGQAAFDECVALESIELPACLSQLDISVFRNCSALKQISLPDGLEEIGAFMFESCSSLESIRIPDTVKRIGRSAFYGCTSLKDFAISDGVETVGEYAFTLTPLTDGTKELLPEDIEETGVSASELLSGIGLIIPIDENGLIMYDLYNKLPASRRTLDWRKADCILLRHVWYQSRSDYVYVGTTTPATGAYNTYTELWLYVPDGDAVHVATALTYPPESGTPPLRGSVTDGGAMFGQIEDLF